MGKSSLEKPKVSNNTTAVHKARKVLTSLQKRKKRRFVKRALDMVGRD